MMMTLNEKTMKFAFHTVGIILLIQNIYFYNLKFGWTVLPLFVLYAIIIDIFKTEIRSYKKELISLLIFVNFSLSLIFLNQNNSTYFTIASIELLAVIAFCFQLVLKMFFLFRNEEPGFFINTRNSRLIEKKTRFMPAFLICLEFALVFAATRVLLGL